MIHVQFHVSVDFFACESAEHMGMRQCSMERWVEE